MYATLKSFAGPKARRSFGSLKALATLVALLELGGEGLVEHVELALGLSYARGEGVVAVELRLEPPVFEVVGGAGDLDVVGGVGGEESVEPDRERGVLVGEVEPSLGVEGGEVDVGVGLPHRRLHFGGIAVTAADEGGLDEVVGGVVDGDLQPSRQARGSPRTLRDTPNPLLPLRQCRRSWRRGATP